MQNKKIKNMFSCASLMKFHSHRPRCASAKATLVNRVFARCHPYNRRDENAISHTFNSRLGKPLGSKARKQNSAAATRSHGFLLALSTSPDTSCLPEKKKRALSETSNATQELPCFLPDVLIWIRTDVISRPSPPTKKFSEVFGF